MAEQLNLIYVEDLSNFFFRRFEIASLVSLRKTWSTGLDAIKEDEILSALAVKVVPLCLE